MSDRKIVTVTVQTLGGPKEIQEERARLTKRTNDPKLAALEQMLWQAGIKSWRDGESFHAPLLWVRAEMIDEAWAILAPIDDIDDDDPRWLEYQSRQDEDRLIAELAALDDAYAESDRQEQEAREAWIAAHPGEDLPEDEMELLRRAGLDHRGQP